MPVKGMYLKKKKDNINFYLDLKPIWWPLKIPVIFIVFPLMVLVLVQVVLLSFLNVRFKND